MGRYIFRRKTIALLVFLGVCVSLSSEQFSTQNEIRYISKFSTQSESRENGAVDQTAHMSIPVNPTVERYVAYYTAGEAKRQMAEIWERAQLYRSYIQREIGRMNLPYELIYVPVVESEYRVEVVSQVGATGLWQLMTDTASYFGLRMDTWLDERKDFWKSTTAIFDSCSA